MTIEEAVQRCLSLLPPERPRPDLLPSDEEAVRTVLAALDERTERVKRLEDLAAVATNYVRVSRSSRSPYIRENSLQGGVSPWAEVVEAVARLDGAEGGAT